jgi:Ca2+-binding RTX toxin-like protein
MKPIVVAIAGVVIGLGVGFYAGQEGVPRFFGQLEDGTSNDDSLVGGLGNDSFHGKAGADIIVGGEGDDILYGDEGDDQLRGEGGADQLSGGEGSDRLWGGTDMDWFVFKKTAVQADIDRIEDFEPGDLVVLEDLGITSYEPGGANGTVFARDADNGGVLFGAITSMGEKFTFEILDPGSVFSAAQFTAADFTFVD